MEKCSQHQVTCDCIADEVKHISKKDRIVLVVTVVIAGIIFLRPIAARSLYIQATNFHGIGEKEKAVSILKKSLILNPKFALAFEELGNIYEEDDSQKATYYHNKAVLIDTSPSYSYAYLAKKYFKEERYNKVVELCSPLMQSKKINKEHILPLKFLCLAYERIGDKKGEYSCWEKIFKIEPKDGMARGKLGK